MDVAIIEYLPTLGYEVWLTDIIEVGEGMGDVFDTKREALAYAQGHVLPILDLSHEETPVLEGEELRAFMSKYLELTPEGVVVCIKRPESDRRR